MITLGSLSAQNFIGKLNPSPEKEFKQQSNDTVKILAVMVSFQSDKDGTTFGTGKFGSIYSEDYGNSILDPLPHNKTYFENHLTFVKNYFNKVSKGQQEISFTVIPDTFSVTKTMRNYSPDPGTDDYTKMGDFAKEVWQKAVQLNPSINFSDYDIFLIFHAGVGRDISLPGSLGNERDLPSIYLSDKVLRDIFNDDLTGLPINKNGKTNSLIIPETESRELETISGKFLFEITINGLLVASIASHLGLPDLFDTETGLSAIGRFGLMDGQSIFAYNGCFPPEPSAWEKIDLGWATPTEVDLKNMTVNVAADLAASLSDTVILKVPINSSEYFLIENRQRDINNNDANLTYVVDGNTFTHNFSDTTGFYSYDTDSLAGVVVNVDEFDWALPGNGIVIWHIDESVINEKRASNKINVDKDRRGVDVEEADGIQDIGEKYITVFGDEVIGEGTDEDFWFRGNKAKFYKNIFSKESRPNTLTNSGANSLITIKSFSTNSNRMSFLIEFGDSIIKPLFNSPGLVTGNNTTITSINSDKYLFALNSDSVLYISNGDSIINSSVDFSEFKPVTFNYSGKTYLVGLYVGNPAQQNPTRINIWSLDDLNNSFSGISLPYVITAAPVIVNNNEAYELYLGTSDGKILVYDFQSLINGNISPKEEKVISNNAQVKQISILNSNLYAIANRGGSGILYIKGDTVSFNNEELYRLVSTIDNKGKVVNIVSSRLGDNYQLNIVIDGIADHKLLLNNIDALGNFSVADIKNDGNNYILVNSDDRINVYNLSGALAGNFPYILKDGEKFAGLPLASDIEGDSKSEILTFTMSGKVYAFEGGTGKVIDGFPVSFGDSIKTAPVLFNTGESIALCGIDFHNNFKAWTVSMLSGRLDWAELFGNNLNHSSLGSASVTNSINEFFPVSKAYNYPNPVYDGQTAIRYFVSQDSKINIKIFDIAGDFVAEFNTEAIGGLDNETIWNVGNIQSGVYFAKIEATGNNGQTENVVIKIAVVK